MNLFGPLFFTIAILKSTFRPFNFEKICDLCWKLREPTWSNIDFVRHICICLYIYIQYIWYTLLIHMGKLLWQAAIFKTHLAHSQHVTTATNHSQFIKAFPISLQIIKFLRGVSWEKSGPVSVFWSIGGTALLVSTANQRDWRDPEQHPQ